VDSLPTSANKEDHVSLGMTAALKLRQVTENVRTVLAIELLAAAQALEFRRPLRSSDTLEAVLGALRKTVSFIDRDRNLSVYIAAAARLIADRALPLPV